MKRKVLEFYLKIYGVRYDEWYITKGEKRIETYGGWAPFPICFDEGDIVYGYIHGQITPVMHGEAIYEKNKLVAFNPYFWKERNITSLTQKILNHGS